MCVCVCVCVLKLLRYYDAMSCLPIVSDRAATEGSKYFELGRQPHEFLTRNTCSNTYVLKIGPNSVGHSETSHL